MSSDNLHRRKAYSQQEFDWRPLLFGAGSFALAWALSQDKASRPAEHRAAEPNWWWIAAIAGALATPSAIKPRCQQRNLKLHRCSSLPRRPPSIGQDLGAS